MLSRVFFVFALLALIGLVSATPSPMALAAKADECGGKDYGTAGDFSFYVYAQSWSANFCSGKPSYPGCKNPTPYMRANLTLHGMWPNYDQSREGHEWPQCCPTKYSHTISRSDLSNLMPALQQYWPNEQDPNPSDSSLSNSLWQHEWGKHGTCSGLSIHDYFQAGLKLMVSPQLQTPRVLQEAVGSTIAPSDLIKAYNNGQVCGAKQPCKVVLHCQSKSSNQYLSEIQTCWDQQFNQINCPAAVVGSPSCTKAYINVQSFDNNHVKQNNKLQRMMKIRF